MLTKIYRLRRIHQSMDISTALGHLRPSYTQGILYAPDGRVLSFTLEDPVRTTKIKGVTAIPEGTYRLTLRTHGSHHKRYANAMWISDVHRGMIEVEDVPNFKHILIHVGNDDTDTEGCILIGRQLSMDGTPLLSSRAGYRSVYQHILENLKDPDVQVLLDIREVS